TASDFRGLAGEAGIPRGSRDLRLGCAATFLHRLFGGGCLLRSEPQVAVPAAAPTRVRFVLWHGGGTWDGVCGVALVRAAVSGSLPTEGHFAGAGGAHDRCRTADFVWHSALRTIAGRPRQMPWPHRDPTDFRSELGARFSETTKEKRGTLNGWKFYV